jgi:hypothetical protein
VDASLRFALRCVDFEGLLSKLLYLVVLKKDFILCYLTSLLVVDHPKSAPLSLLIPCYLSVIHYLGKVYLGLTRPILSYFLLVCLNYNTL